MLSGIWLNATSRLGGLWSTANPWMCASLYAHFVRYLQDASYYPPGVEQVSDNRLFAMFHSCTDEHNKRVVMSSLSQADGVVPWLWEWGWISRATYKRISV